MAASSLRIASAFDVRQLSDVACLLTATGNLDRLALSELRSTVACLMRKGVRDLVLDLSATKTVGTGVVEPVVDVATRLDELGGALLLAADRPDAKCGYIMRRVDPSDSGSMLGINLALDRAIVRSGELGGRALR